MIKIPMRFLAADKGGGTGADEGAASASPAQDPAQAAAQEQPVQEQKPAFADLIKDDAYQDALAAYNKELLEAERKRWADEQQEAERLAKLSPDQKLADERAKFERERQEYGVTKALAAKQLPTDFAKLLIGGSDAETDANVAAFETAFRAAVDAAVSERIKGQPPKTGTTDTGASYLDNKYKDNPYYKRG